MSSGAGSDFDTSTQNDINDPWAQFVHFLYSWKHLPFHTEIPNPDSQTFLDSAADHWSETISPSVGKYVREGQKHKRTNMVAHQRKRATETERIAEAAKEDSDKRRSAKDQLLGEMTR